MQLGMIGAAFLAGLLSFFSPCILPLLPVYIGLLTTDAGNSELGLGRRVLNTVAFVLGISTTFLILGLGAGAVGTVLNNAYVAVACGIVIFVFGLHLSGFMTIPFLQREKRVDTSKLKTSTAIGAYLLGLGFSFGWTPCIGPILGSVLALASQQGTALAGAGLTLVYSLGMSIPFLIITLASNVLISKVRTLNKYLPVIQRIGGALIAIMGLWMVFSQVHELSAGPSMLQSSAVQEQAASSDAAAQSNDEADAWRHIEFKDTEGKVQTIADYEGSPLYIEFWGSWCPECMENMDAFREMAARHNAAGDVKVISIASPGHFGEKDEADFVKWCEEQGYEFPILMDNSAELVKYFNLVGFPSSVFVDASGKVQMVRAGAVPSEELEGLFKTLREMA